MSMQVLLQCHVQARSQTFCRGGGGGGGGGSNAWLGAGGGGGGGGEN